MPINIAAHIGKSAFTQEVFTDLLNTFFKCNAVKEILNSGIVRYTNISADDEIIGYFSEKLMPPSNCWESNLLNSDYIFSQSICFSVSKSSDIDKKFKIVFEFLIFLEKKFPFEMLLISDVHDDICYTDENLNFKWTGVCGYINQDILNEILKKDSNSP